MIQSKSLLTINHRISSSEKYIESINDNCYFFVGDSLESDNIVQPTNSTNDIVLNAHYGMLFGKKINSNNAMHMIRRVEWETGVVYDTYDHEDPLLYDKNFYVITHNGSNFDVFKCLENGNRQPSTVEPSVLNVNSNQDTFFYPNDGYRWKYLYSISEDVEDEFSTEEYFPVITNQTVKDKTLEGSIDVIRVTSPGIGYSNYYNGTFTISDIRLNGDHTLYSITGNNIKTVNDFYEGCWLYISSGAGAGQYRLIESYTCNNTHNVMRLIEPFDLPDIPQNGSQYEIYPSVNIKGDGRETRPAKARAVIDPTSNTINRIEMLDSGSGYNETTASVYASDIVNVSNEAVIRPIYSPKNGHGYDPKVELNGSSVCVSVKLSGSEGNTVITENDYSQIGIIKDPLFNNINLDIEDANKGFVPNELVYKIRTRQLVGTVDSTLDSNTNLTSTLVLNSVLGPNIASVGDTLIIDKEDEYMMVDITAVSNSTITINNNIVFDTANNGANIHLVTYKESYGTITSLSNNSITLTDVRGSFDDNDIIYGETSMARARVGDVKMGGRDKPLNTFLGCYTYVGNLTQGEFQEDEEVYQIGDAIAVARYNSSSINVELNAINFYLTYQNGVINTSGDGLYQSSIITGTSSGAVAELTHQFMPDIVFGTGEIVYLENGEAISRSNEITEHFKIIINF